MADRADSAYGRFLSECEADRGQLLALRISFFGILGLDSFHQIAHAPRYGAGGFNVSHLPWADRFLPTPTPEVMVALFLLEAFLAFRLALGPPSRRAITALAALFAYSTLCSQLDSYQHHYLVLLLLFLFRFVPWSSSEPRHWSLRLVLLQCSVLYFWAAVAKLDGRWLDGTALHAMTAGKWIDVFVESTVGWATASVLVAGVELFLAIAIHVPRLRGLAAVLGLAFHIGVEAAGFEIGLFSYYMVALYALVLPPAPWRSLRGRLRRLWERRGFGAAPPQRAELSFAASVLLLLGLALWSPTVLDYYRFTGGSARRLGDLERAATAYERAVALAPRQARTHAALGRIYRLQGRFDDALAELRAARRLASGDPSLSQREARLLERRARREEALVAAARASERGHGLDDRSRPGESR